MAGTGEVKKNQRSIESRKTYRPSQIKVLVHIKVRPGNKRVTPIDYMTIMNIEDLIEDAKLRHGVIHNPIYVSRSTHSLKGLMRAIRHNEEKEKKNGPRSA